MSRNPLNRAPCRSSDNRAELASCPKKIAARRTAGTYHPSEAELAGIDRGLADACAGRFATDEQVAAVFARHRRA